MSRLHYILWGIFLLTPCLTTNILEYFFASDLLAFACALFAASCMAIYAKSEPSHQSTWAWTLLAIILLPAALHLILQTASNPWGVYRVSAYIVAVFIIFRMSQSTANDMLNNTTWIAILGWIANFFALIAILQMFAFIPEDSNSLYAIWNHAIRFSGPLLQPNLSSLFFDIVIVSLLVQGIRTSFQSIWFILTILPIASVIASNSRSGMLLLALIFCVLWVQSTEKKKIFIVFLGTLSVSVLLAFQWNSLLQSNGQELVLASRLSEGGFSDRISLWYSAFHLFAGHPMLGIGYGNLSAHFAEAQAYTLQQHPSWMAFSSANYWAHNLILHFFTEGGIIGGFAILMLLYIILQRGWHILRQSDAINHPQFLSFMVVSLIVLHGLVSISFFQGFFLCLFGLYLAGLFPGKSTQPNISTNKYKAYHILYFIPAIYASIICYQFINTQVNIDAVFDDNPDSPRFIAEVSEAIDNPWLAHAGLEYLFANMELTHAPAYQWINMYPYMFQASQISQDPATLRRLILQAHLSGNRLSEKYWGELFLQAYPNNSWAKLLEQHIKEGHQLHEPLRMNFH